MAGLALERKRKSGAETQGSRGKGTAERSLQGACVAQLRSERKRLTNATGSRMNEGQKQDYRGNEAALDWRAEVHAPGCEGRATRSQAEKEGIAAPFIREAAAAWGACGAFECVALAYLAASSALIAIFAENLAHPLRLFSVQTLVTAAILVLCRIDVRVAEHAKCRGE